MSLRGALAVGRELPMPPPDAPTPFALADPERVRTILGSAGFDDVDLEPIDEPIDLGTDASDALEFAKTMGIVEGLTDGPRRTTASAAMSNLADLFHERETADGVLLGSAAWLITARRGCGRRDLPMPSTAAAASESHAPGGDPRRQGRDREVDRRADRHGSTAGEERLVAVAEALGERSGDAFVVDEVGWCPVRQPEPTDEERSGVVVAAHRPCHPGERTGPPGLVHLAELQRAIEQGADLGLGRHRVLSGDQRRRRDGGAS